MLEKVIAGVLIVVVVGVLVWFFTPARNRLETVRLKATDDHGLRLHVAVDPDQLSGVTTRNLTGIEGLEPEFLVGNTFYLPVDEPPDAPAPDADWWRWASEHDGADLVFSHVLVRIQATQDRSIVLNQPVIHRTRLPITHGAIYGPEGVGGNGLLVRRFFVDLEQGDPPTVRYIDAAQNEQETAQFEMKKGDTQAFLVIAEANKDRHEWTIDFPCLVDGVAFTLTATRAGRPFVTVGAADVPGFMWVEDEKRWVGYDPQ